MPALEEGPSTGPSWLIIHSRTSPAPPEGARVIRLPPISGLPHQEPGPVGALQGPSQRPDRHLKILGYFPDRLGKRHKLAQAYG